jgi:adenine deaminase
LLGDGGIDHLLRRLVAYGMDPLVALRCATYNAAYRLQRSDLGLVAAGRRADIAVLSDLESFAAEHVITDGRVVASHGRMLVDVIEGPSDPPLDTMRLSSLDAADMLLHLDAPDGVHRMRVIADAVMTRWDEADVTVRDGVVQIPDDYIVQVTVHRHGRITPEPHAALLSGWGNWTGAIATTIAHDTHNLVVFGRDPDEMALAANTVIASGGGVAVVQGSDVLGHIPLPIAGILSPLPAAEVADAQRQTQDAAMSIGLFAPTLTQPLFQVMLSSLACLPGPHVTDVGLIDGTTGERVATALLP